MDPPLEAVREVVAAALREDLGAFGDLTAGLIPSDVSGAASLSSREFGVLAGRLSASEAFRAVDPTVHLEWFASDGERLSAGQTIAKVRGPLGSMLTAERTALNLLGHLSGIATLTRRYADEAGHRSRVRDTRKTTPGLRALEKAAVRAGGGVNHRGSLSDGILVKDNHLAGLTIFEAVTAAHHRWPTVTCQVECDTLDQVSEAMYAGADALMLDNMAPGMAAEAVRIVAGRVPVEVSGRVSLESIGAYADAGVDFISVGALTHSAPVLDIGLDLDPEDQTCSSPST
jgi:nicotinate-nucleotide pyrophosphorylase (carboxylating)